MSDRQVLMTPKQLASSLMRIYFAAMGVSAHEQARWQIDHSRLHFHDGSQAEIAWNDVQAVRQFNELTGLELPIPAAATEAYNRHGHTSEYDGGYIPGSGPHDHRDTLHGGFAFAVYHPGTDLPMHHFAL